MYDCTYLYNRDNPYLPSSLPSSLTPHLSPLLSLSPPLSPPLSPLLSPLYSYLSSNHRLNQTLLRQSPPPLPLTPLSPRPRPLHTRKRYTTWMSRVPLSILTRRRKYHTLYCPIRILPIPQLRPDPMITRGIPRPLIQVYCRTLLLS